MRERIGPRRNTLVRQVYRPISYGESGEEPVTTTTVSILVWSCVCPCCICVYYIITTTGLQTTRIIIIIIIYQYVNERLEVEKKTKLVPIYAFVCMSESETDIWKRRCMEEEEW